MLLTGQMQLNLNEQPIKRSTAVRLPATSMRLQDQNEEEEEEDDDVRTTKMSNEKQKRMMKRVHDRHVPRQRSDEKGKLNVFLKNGQKSIIFLSLSLSPCLK